MKSRCAFCGKLGRLARSHIIPEFLLRVPMGENRRGLAIPSSGRPPRLVQQAFQYPLLCFACEQYFNDSFEAPFHDVWYKRNAAPWVVQGPVYRLDLPDYNAFKLFFLSVLWRAGVCSAQPFANVNLSEHEAPIRQMLVERVAGPAGDFPLVGAVIHMPDSLQVSHIAASPFATKWQDCQAYALTFGGCIWHLLLRRGDLPEYLRRWALAENGKMDLRVIDMSEVRPLSSLLTGYIQLARQGNWRNPWTQEKLT